MARSIKVMQYKGRAKVYNTNYKVSGLTVEDMVGETKHPCRSGLQATITLILGDYYGTHDIPPSHLVAIDLGSINQNNIWSLTAIEIRHLFPSCFKTEATVKASGWESDCCI
ncbi:uncharacterized protein FOMMEDRAFT_15961 [Fomitiporia mediterranea MF3/22]|uniref:uncharacterized protein n=1 Tax=Fomitiporia mediterranea (strain MF3/22) TaxID=694068 RepID=UPI0004409066|nr:uncharacterized protein FOMMEDRAFT_15961 [Fomitiporia mediterranea MF3/22]EJD07239.1 hypothetical protein FOMMEDRAFT_15961 [Fomitiporia mediterranea MF3/22]